MTRTHFQRLSRWSVGNLGAFGMTAALGLIGVGVIAPQCAPPPPPASPPALVAGVQVAGVQDGALALTNERRIAAGLDPLVVDARLTGAAQSHANDMATRQVMTHSGSDNSNAGQRIAVQGYGATAWAENVASGQTTASDAVNAWMNSSGHRANILNQRYVNIGVAAATDSKGVTYWTMVLAA